MLSLREVQQAFVRGALHGDIDQIATHVVGDAIPARKRIGIYANNARENFTSTLQAAFPVVCALGGEDWFRQVAQGYWRRHPSHAGNLHNVGERFAAHLHEQLANTSYAYFADVAALEWAYQESMVAAEHPGFDVAALSSVPPERYGELRFALHPTVRLVSSAFPILDVWRAHQPAATNIDALDLATGAQHVVLLRLTDHVQFRAIDQSSWTLLHALSCNETLNSAAQAALALDPQFNLAAALAQFIGLTVLVDFSLPT